MAKITRCISLLPSGGTHVHSASGSAADSGTWTWVRGTNVSWPAIVLPDATGRVGWDWQFMLSDDYSGSMTAKVFWKANATSGNCYWQFSASGVGAGESVWPSLTAGTAFTDTTGGTANTLNITAAQTVPGTFAAGDYVTFRVERREDVGATDTLAADVELLAVVITYETTTEGPSSGKLISQGHISLPVNCGVYRAINPSARLKIDRSTDTNVEKFVVEFPDGVTSTWDMCFPIPGDYDGGTITAYVNLRTPATTNATRWSVDWVPIGEGEAVDAAPLKFPVTVTSPSTANEVSVYISPIIAVTAGDLLMFSVQRIGADAADTNTSVAQLLHVYVQYRTAG